MPFVVDAVILRKATRGPVLTSLKRLSNREPSQWIPAGHAGQRGELPSKWQNIRQVHVSQVIDTIAIAAPQHCMDGWAFVSRSLSCLLAGDLHSTRHLA